MSLSNTIFINTYYVKDKKKFNYLTFPLTPVTYSKKPLVGIIMGSSSDSRIMQGAAQILDKYNIKHEDQIVSAHRTPARLAQYAKHAEEKGFSIIIAGAGGAAHLPGMIASHTIIPVIGVPILVYNDKHPKNTDAAKFSAFGGLDSLLSITEMPSGSPVVAVGVNKAGNAGLYAIKILANQFQELKDVLAKHKSSQHDMVLEESEQLKEQGLTEFASKRF